MALAHASKRHKTVTIVGGGETAAAVEGAGVASSITHVSTGGGASLQMLEGRALPGLSGLGFGIKELLFEAPPGAAGAILEEY